MYLSAFGATEQQYGEMKFGICSVMLERCMRIKAETLLPFDDDDKVVFDALNLVKQRELADYQSRLTSARRLAISRARKRPPHYYASKFVPKILKRASHPV